MGTCVDLRTCLAVGQRNSSVGSRAEEKKLPVMRGVGNGLVVTNNNYAYFLLRLMAHMSNYYIVQFICTFLPRSIECLAYSVEVE